MNEFDVSLRLDEDFLFILNFTKEYMSVFVEDPESNARVQQWFSKLCCEVVHGIAAKRLRNTYLVRFIACLQSGKLTEPFDLPPQPGPLPSLPLIDVGDREPPWLNELILEAKERTESHAKDARTYLATKVFDHNKGACAYLAVSVADEGEIPAWAKLGTGKEFEEHLDRVFSRITVQAQSDVEPPPADDKQSRFDKKFHEYLIEAVAIEMSGLAAPGQNAQVEKILEKYKKYIEGSTLGEEAGKLAGGKLRNFLLMHLHSQLVNEFVD